ncbi:hypothetical protein GGTG_08268 [Gaeumannomyces tritici R3-111a-1]|uniref:Uncharacterized protein n=1 Tax=Gaeumannomyces tritici (strain R3-111a-1) TaxID=644352 RepID=J3P431_GAET3|nr:hypothetical protein GGTG_08268 [Gaeumannomyces tritici R3-111a-1]EJT74427.1 hypothetical protein GGTG_08268 [Gaeumannomyces tritici R3-111a-1]
MGVPGIRAPNPNIHRDTLHVLLIFQAKKSRTGNRIQRCIESRGYPLEVSEAHALYYLCAESPSLQRWDLCNQRDEMASWGSSKGAVKHGIQCS